MSNYDSFIKSIKQHVSPVGEYHREVFQKKQVTIHHTASGGDSKGDINYLNTLVGKVHVPLWIDRDGTKWQAFGTRYYAPHLGTPSSTFAKYKISNTVDNLHKHSIGIELDSWGWLEKGGYTNSAGKWIKKETDKFYSYTGAEIKEQDVVIYPEGFLGKKYYERYYPLQIEELRKMLLYLCDTYNITKEYQCDMWAVSPNALSGKEGIFTHISYRESGKWDCHPQKELIDMLKSLN